MTLQLVDRRILPVANWPPTLPTTPHRLQEYCETKLLTFKKALYLELMLQLSLYLFLIVSTVDWSGALIILAGFYLDTK